MIALRGSAVAGTSFKTGEPFDAHGPHTSDLDIVLIGDPVVVVLGPGGPAPGRHQHPAALRRRRLGGPGPRSRSTSRAGDRPAPGQPPGDGALVPRAARQRAGAAVHRPQRGRVTRIVTYNIRKGGLRRRRLIADVLQGDRRRRRRAPGGHRPARRPAAGRGDRLPRRSSTPRAARWPSSAGASRPEALWHRMARARNFAEVTLPRLDLRILAVHLGAGLSGRPERRRLRQVERVLATACAGPGPGSDDDHRRPQRDRPRRAARTSRPCRDASGCSSAWTAGMGTVVIDRVLAEGFIDAYRTLNPDGDGSTMPAVAPTVRLDYVMVGPDLVPLVAACGIPAIDPALLRRASDHLPIVAGPGAARLSAAGAADRPGADMEPQRPAGVAAWLLQWCRLGDCARVHRASGRGRARRRSTISPTPAPPTRPGRSPRCAAPAAGSTTWSRSRAWTSRSSPARSSASSARAARARRRPSGC